MLTNCGGVNPRKCSLKLLAIKDMSYEAVIAFDAWLSRGPGHIATSEL